MRSLCVKLTEGTTRERRAGAEGTANPPRKRARCVRSPQAETHKRERGKKVQCTFLGATEGVPTEAESVHTEALVTCNKMLRSIKLVKVTGLRNVTPSSKGDRSRASVTK